MWCYTPYLFNNKRSSEQIRRDCVLSSRNFHQKCDKFCDAPTFICEPAPLKRSAYRPLYPPTFLRRPNPSAPCLAPLPCLVDPYCCIHSDNSVQANMIETSQVNRVEAFPTFTYTIINPLTTIYSSDHVKNFQLNDEGVLANLSRHRMPSSGKFWLNTRSRTAPYVSGPLNQKRSSISHPNAESARY